MTDSVVISSTEQIIDTLTGVVDDVSDRVLLAAVTGSHQYGFSSVDSDYDVRGCYIEPLDTFLTLGYPRQVLEKTQVVDGLEIDLVLFDIRKFLQLLLAGNGNVLEALYSPLHIVEDGLWLPKLRGIASLAVSKRTIHHYLGFADSIWTKFVGKPEKRVKELLYVYRTLLTGLYLADAGILLANLPLLAKYYKCSWLQELIDKKVNGTEKMIEDFSEWFDFYEGQYQQLRERLEEAIENDGILPSPHSKQLIDAGRYADEFLIEIRRETDRE